MSRTSIERNCDFFEVAKLSKEDSFKLNSAQIITSWTFWTLKKKDSFKLKPVLHKREHKKTMRKNGSNTSFINFPTSFFFKFLSGYLPLMSIRWNLPKKGLRREAKLVCTFEIAFFYEIKTRLTKKEIVARVLLKRMRILVRSDNRHN